MDPAGTNHDPAAHSDAPSATASLDAAQASTRAGAHAGLEPGRGSHDVTCPPFFSRAKPCQSCRLMRGSRDARGDASIGASEQGSASTGRGGPWRLPPVHPRPPTPNRDSTPSRTYIPDHSSRRSFLSRYFSSARGVHLRSPAAAPRHPSAARRDLPRRVACGAGVQGVACGGGRGALGGHAGAGAAADAHAGGCVDDGESGRARAG